MILTRTEKRADGIFGYLTNENGTRICYSLEHAFATGGDFRAKVPPGSYSCHRGMHRLLHMQHEFETFEIRVPDHTNILFHVGNYNEDSEGCILLGDGMYQDPNGRKMLTHSKDAFQKFMIQYSKYQEFKLLIREE